MAEQAAVGPASLTPNRQTQELEDGKPAASGIGKHFFVRFLPANPQPFRSDPAGFAHRWERVDSRRFSSQEPVGRRRGRLVHAIAQHGGHAQNNQEHDENAELLTILFTH